MEDPIKQAVLRAVTTMRQNLGEQLTIDDMARSAMFSKFHFTRIFQRVTGVSPGRFLSALRLEQAKRLLLSTSLNVADISLRVGYSSVGTFSSRFTRSVGMSPTTYRRRAGYAHRITTDPGPHAVQSNAVMHGLVRPSEFTGPGLVFIGLFADRIPQGQPARCTILSSPGPYRLEAVPPGTWYLLAQSVTGESPEPGRQPDLHRQSISVATHGPLTFQSDTTIKTDLRLKPVHDLDPPVLLALLDVRTMALARNDLERVGAHAAEAQRGLELRSAA
ncbi:helix-turn-helix domain-containing protein [Micromonospora sp. NPDC051543]|uniref:helix-turn-helix domain-containing protein n=1 Tax=Micromonospora sp. NPDC051543 TaxID=3364287 RepID=UPI0037A9D051